MYSFSIDYMFKLIRSFVNETEPERSANVDWNELFHYAAMHTVDGIIGYECTKYHLCDDRIIASKMEKSMINTFGLHYRKAEQMKRLIVLLNENNIDHILMKGYVIKDIYPVPELRTYGDIDFVIREKDRLKTDKLMREHGYTVTANWEPVYSYKKDTEYYEIHTQLLDTDFTEEERHGIFADVWQHIKKRKGNSFELVNEYHFIYLIAHLAKHAEKNGAGIRMYLDIALFIMNYSHELDWSYIENQLKELELSEFFSTVCMVCQKLFGTELPVRIEEHDSDIIDQFIDVIIEGGVFGAANDVGVTSLIDGENNDLRQRKLRLVLRQLFPPGKDIAIRYTYLQKYPWLLPIAWIDRMIKNKAKVKHKLTVTKQIIHADTKKAQNMQDLNKKVGL